MSDRASSGTITTRKLGTIGAEVLGVDPELSDTFTDWVRANRPRGQVVFEDHFDAADDLSSRWTNVAPGDDAAGG